MGYVELGLNFFTDGVENIFGNFATFENSDGEAFSAGTDENVIARDGGFEKHFFWEEFAQCSGSFVAFLEIVLQHREADPEHVKARVDDTDAVEAF